MPVAGRTLSALRTAVQARGYTSDSAAQQNELINAAIRAINTAKDWYWVTVRASTAITASSTVVDVPATFARVKQGSVSLTVGSETLPLEYKDPQEFQRLTARPNTGGAAQHYSVWGNQLYFWPAPTAAGTLTYLYIAEQPTLTLDTDTTTIPTRYNDVIVWAVISDIAYRERDINAHDRAQGMYLRLLSDMKRQETSPNTRIISDGL